MTFVANYIYPVRKFSKHLLGSYLPISTIKCISADHSYDMSRRYILTEDQFGQYRIYHLSNSNLEQSECPLMSVKSYWLTSVNNCDFIPIPSTAENKTLSYTAYSGIHASKFLYLRNRFLQPVGYRGKLLHDANWNFTTGEIPKEG